MRIITIGDSVIYLTNKYRGLQKPIIERLENERLMLIESIGGKSKIEQDRIGQHIASNIQIIDSLKHSISPDIEKYKNKDPNTSLVRVIKCSYEEIRENGDINTSIITLNLSNDGSVM